MVLVRNAPDGDGDARLPLVTTGRAARQGWRYRGNVAARAAAAILGGYGIAALFAFASARLLPMPRLDAIIPGTLLAFLIMPGVAVWAFLARSALRAWGVIVAIAALLWMLGWWAGVPA